MCAVIESTKLKTMTFISLKNSFVVVALLLLAQLFPSAVLAQEAVTFTVSPTIFDMTANPGQTWQSTIRIINANPFELGLSVSVVNFAPKGETGAPQFLPVTNETEPNSTLAQWISTKNEVVVGAEKTIELPIMITLPPEAAPGGHFAALMISTKPVAGNGGQQVQTSQVISSLIFLRVSGDISENSSIRSFRTTNYLLSKPEATFELRIENKGNVHVKPHGEIRIFNMWGQERGSIPINQQTLFGNVLPNSVRKYSFTWSSEWSITDIGRYTAEASLSYGTDGKQSLSADTAFWIVPWKWLLLIIVVVGGFLTLITFSIKLYVRHMLRMAGITPGHHVPVSAVEQIAITTGPKSKKRKTVSVVAPIEAGILDLRARLNKTDTFKAYLVTLVSFVKAYWKFFAGVLLILLFLLIVILFFKGALTPARDFEVTIEGEGQSVTVKSDAPEGEGSAPPTEITANPQVIIKIVNRSGDESLTGKAKSIIEREGLTVSDVSVDFGTLEERTVIVYTPEFADAALKLSMLFDNALLSAYIPEDDATPELVVYVGSDITTLP